jgi:hypothetical protein
MPSRILLRTISDQTVAGATVLPQYRRLCNTGCVGLDVQWEKMFHAVLPTDISTRREVWAGGG